MTLRQKRCAFTEALAGLIQHAIGLGYEVALDEATEHLTVKDPTSDHMRGSLHHVGLAADLNLYRNGKWLSRTKDHAPLGEWWEKQHPLARWGGRFSRPDGNHYSFAHNGVA